MILHLIQRSPFSNSAFEDCLKIYKPKDSILFMEDGVYALNHHATKNMTKNIYALNDDIQARGLTAPPQIKAIEYHKFVSLCQTHTQVMSWY